MFSKESIKRYFRQILAFIEKNLYLQLRIRTEFFNRFLNPIFNFFVFLIIFGTIFNIKKGYSLGYWNSSNYILFLLIAYFIQFSKPLIPRYQNLFTQEKYWKTLSAIMVAPVNRFILLFGVLISELIVIMIPVSILLIIAYILYPISLINLFLILLILFAIYLIFGSIGLIIGVFAISNEEYITYMNLFLKATFLFSCTNYPKEIFPEIVQYIILLNPIYYIFDLLRLIWYLGISYDAAIKLITPLHIIMILLMTILAPVISLYLFNRIYKKYGITGY
ncbi:MAG: ABC transporter permease [Candidatus Hodarchaeota archaeon]